MVIALVPTLGLGIINCPTPFIYLFDRNFTFNGCYLPLPSSFIITITYSGTAKCHRIDMEINLSETHTYRVITRNPIADDRVS